MGAEFASIMYFSRVARCLNWQLTKIQKGQSKLHEIRKHQSEGAEDEKKIKKAYLISHLPHLFYLFLCLLRRFSGNLLPASHAVNIRLVFNSFSDCIELHPTVMATSMMHAVDVHIALISCAKPLYAYHALVAFWVAITMRRSEVKPKTLPGF